MADAYIYYPEEWVLAGCKDGEQRLCPRSIYSDARKLRDWAKRNGVVKMDAPEYNRVVKIINVDDDQQAKAT